MTPTERRERITAVFELAVRLRPDDQGLFLEQECGGDHVLLAEVQSLLLEYRELGASLSGTESAPDDSDARPIPRRIGRYDIAGEIGSGGGGHVYRALDATVGRVVAIKVLNAPGDPNLIKRFRAEAMTVANLHHKNIVTVHEYGEEDGAPYLVMEFLEGTTVEDLIRQRTPLPLHEKLWIMSEVAEGLQYAHGRGVIHRDVKPANIMRLTDGSVKIMDFGIARLAGANTTRLTQTGFVIGTLKYMAPEQFDGTADALSDIFAYGLTFYELLTGVHPFSSTDPANIVNPMINEPDVLRSLLPGCPEFLERIVNRTLARRRDSRYSNMSDVVVDTKSILLDLRQQQAGDLFSQAGQLFSGGQLEAAQSAVRKALELNPLHAGARQLRFQVEQALRHRDLAHPADVPASVSTGRGVLLSLFVSIRNRVARRTAIQTATVFAGIALIIGFWGFWLYPRTHNAHFPPAPALVQKPIQDRNSRELASLQDAIPNAISTQLWPQALTSISRFEQLAPADRRAVEWREQVEAGLALDRASRDLENAKSETDWEKAEAQIVSLVAKMPDNLTKAEQLVQLGNYPKAIEIFQGVLAQDSGNTRAQSGLNQARAAQKTEDKEFGKGR